MSERSRQQHLEDLTIGEYHFTQGGKSCLNSHTKKYTPNDPCSHRWHARMEGLKLEKVEPGRAGENLYKWPPDVPKQPPPGTSWDLTGENFTESASSPYSFESHHVVPINELSIVINSIGKESALKVEITLLVRKALMQEHYNLNDGVNMIILPTMQEEAFALALPKHKLTLTHPSHHRYSCYVRSKLKKVLAVVKEDVDKHEAEAKMDEKSSKKNKKDAERSDKEAGRQQELAAKNEKKGWSGRAAVHGERAKSHRLLALSLSKDAQSHADKARNQRSEALNKVEANPAGMGKEGIERLSEKLKKEIIAAGLWMKQQRMDGSLENLRDYVKQPDSAPMRPD